MSILLNSGNTENKPQLCATDGNNHLQINQTFIGFLSEFVSVGLHRVPYPGTGESENKVTSAYDEALKTVGYGRLEKPCTIYYNNPFDPRLTFDGLGHLLNATDTETRSLSKEQLAQNVFLALENTDMAMDEFFSQNRNLYNALCSSTDLGLSVDPNRYKLFPEIDGNVSDDGSEDCKRMFEKICSLPIRDIWTDAQERTESVMYSTDQKYDLSNQAGIGTNEVAEIGETPSKTDNLSEKDQSQNKIRYSFKRLEGRHKSVGKQDQNAAVGNEEARRYDLIEREIEQVVSEKSDEEERGNVSDSKDKRSPVQLMPSDTGTGTIVEPQKHPSPPKVTQTEEEGMMTRPVLSTHNTQHKEPDIPMVESRHGLRQVSPTPCQNDYVTISTVTEPGPDHKEAKIREFKEEMEKLATRKDVPKNDVITGDSRTTTMRNDSSQTDIPNSEFSLDLIVAKSVLRPSVPSFYPGFNKGSTTDHENEYKVDEKTQTIANNRVTRPPPGMGQQNTYRDHNGEHNTKGHPSLVNTPAAPQAQTTSHLPTGNFQTHHTAAMRDASQKMDFRSTMTNTRPFPQPPNVNKLQIQPNPAAAAALLMANCMQQSTRKETACNQPQQTPQNKPYSEFLPPIRAHQYQQQGSHLGMPNPYPGQTARNPPPGFNETSQVPIRNRDHLNVPYRSDQGHPQHHLPIQQHLAFGFPAEQSFQYQPQQQTIGGRFPQLPVQNLHQHHIAQQQQQQQQHHQYHHQQQQPQHQHHQQQPQQQQQQQQHHNQQQAQQHHQQAQPQHQQQQQHHHNQQQQVHQHHQQQQQQQQQQQNPHQLQQQQQNSHQLQQQQQQPHHQQHHPHPPLHPLQPQQHFLNPEVPPFQYFNKIPQPTNVNLRATWHLNMASENTNRNNANVDTYENNAKPVISFNSFRLTDDPTVKDTSAEDPGTKHDAAPAESVRIKHISASAECIPSLVNGDCNRESSKDKHRVSKLRSRRSNLVRIYPSNDCS